MGLDIEALLPTLSPEKQEEILDQLDIETAEAYKKKGYGLQVSDTVEHKEYVPTQVELEQPQVEIPVTNQYNWPPPNQTPTIAVPSQAVTNTSKDGPQTYIRVSALVAGFLGTLCLFIFAAVLFILSPIFGVIVLAFSGLPLAVALVYTVRA